MYICSAIYIKRGDKVVLYFPVKRGCSQCNLCTSCGYELLVTSCRGHEMLVYRKIHQPLIFTVITGEM